MYIYIYRELEDEGFISFKSLKSPWHLSQAPEGFSFSPNPCQVKDLEELLVMGIFGRRNFKIEGPLPGNDPYLLKINGWHTHFLLAFGLFFGGYVSFRQCIHNIAVLLCIFLQTVTFSRCWPEQLWWQIASLLQQDLLVVQECRLDDMLFRTLWYIK